jgi:hypothetical protein
MKNQLETKSKVCPCLASLCRDRELLVSNADTTQCHDGNYTQCLNYKMNGRRVEEELPRYMGLFKK